MSVMKIIASDLNQGDKAKQEVVTMENIIISLESESMIKDSIINTLTLVNSNQKKIIQLSDEKYQIMSDNYDYVKNELKKENFNSKLQKLFIGGLIIAITAISIIQ